MNKKGTSPMHGIICLWSGTRETIPDGWVECDGQNGTPDMRMRFAYGGSASFPPLSKGGTWTHAHNLAVNSAPDILSSGDEILSDPPYGNLSPHTFGHSHSGVTNSREHTSPFVSLLFIMKL